MRSNLMLALSVASGLVLAGPAMASNFTTVDISSYVNSNVAINPQTFPTGTTTGNEGTGIPIDVATFPNSGSVAGTWNSGGTPGSTLNVDLTGLGITGQASFYALLNNYYGTPGADEYDITIAASNGDHITYQSIGGVDTRDYNANVFTNSIAATTTQWFNNGIGQRLDIREFTLPAIFAGDTITSFSIDQVQPGDAALFSGLTFSTQGAVVFTPEPASMAMLSMGLVGLIGVARRWRGLVTTPAG